MTSNIDDALAQLADCGAEFSGGLSNHGPMAADALIHLGREEAVGPWIERYRRKLDERARAARPLDLRVWRESLGNYALLPEWEALFGREITEAPWADVVRHWVPRLAPGFLAGATHGMLRTAHAVRSLSLEDTEARRVELARGLAYWAARYWAMPVARADREGLAIDAAVANVPLLPEERRQNNGFITTAVAAVAREPEFAPMIHWFGVSGSVEARIAEFTRAFARIYLENSAIAPIAFIHSVTAPSAIRMLQPVIGDDTARELLRYGWQAGSAFIAAYKLPGQMAALEPPVEVDWDDLADRAVAAGDEHAIKMTEACLREYRLAPDPVFAAAAADVSTRLRAN